MRKLVVGMALGAGLTFCVLEGHFTYRAFVKKWSQPPPPPLADGSFWRQEKDGEAREPQERVHV